MSEDSTSESSQKKSKKKWLLPLLGVGLIGGGYWAFNANKADASDKEAIVQPADTIPKDMVYTLADSDQFTHTFAPKDGTTIFDLDTNNDGYVTQTELDAFSGKLSPFIITYDENKNGDLTNQEVINSFTLNYTEDGKLAKPLFKTYMEDGADQIWRATTNSGCITDLVKDGRTVTFNPTKYDLHGIDRTFTTAPKAEIVPESVAPIEQMPLATKKTEKPTSTYSAKDATVKVQKSSNSGTKSGLAELPQTQYAHNTPSTPVVKKQAEPDCVPTKVEYELGVDGAKIAIPWEGSDIHMYFQGIDRGGLIDKVLPGKQGTSTNFYLFAQDELHSKKHNSGKVNGLKMNENGEEYRSAMRTVGFTSAYAATGGKVDLLLAGGSRFLIQEAIEHYISNRDPLHMKADNVSEVNGFIANAHIELNKSPIKALNQDLHSRYAVVGFDGTNGNPRDGVIQPGEVAIARVDSNRDHYDSLDVIQKCYDFNRAELNGNNMFYLANGAEHFVSGVLEGLVFSHFTQPKGNTPPTSTSGGTLNGGSSGTPTFVPYNPLTGGPSGTL